MLVSKKKNKEFVDGVCKGLIEIGAKKIKDEIDVFRTFELDTIVGKLKINVSTDNNCIFTVFSRFENVALAKEKFSCNPYSGKYNVHIGLVREMTVEQYVDIVISHFELTLPKELA